MGISPKTDKYADITVTLRHVDYWGSSTDLEPLASPAGSSDWTTQPAGWSWTPH